MHAPVTLEHACPEGARQTTFLLTKATILRMAQRRVRTLTSIRCITCRKFVWEGQLLQAYHSMILE